MPAPYGVPHQKKPIKRHHNPEIKTREISVVCYRACTDVQLVCFCFWREGYRGGCGMGPVQIACLGVKLNDGSTQLVATVVNEGFNQPDVHLAIIQVCFSS